jgi:hypothetical protein
MSNEPLRQTGASEPGGTVSDPQPSRTRIMSTPQSLTAGAIVLRRWRNVLALGTLLFAVVLAAAWLERKNLDVMVGLPVWLLAVAAIAPIVALALYLAPARFVGALGLRHTLVYPPYWFGVAMGVGFALYAVANVEVFNADFRIVPSTEETLQQWALAVIALPGAVIVTHTLISICREPVIESQLWAESKASVPARRNRKLDAWYAADDAVASAADDLLDYGPIAERIARRLVTDRAQAQALLGRLGSGKTTVFLLVKEYLRIRFPRAPITVISVELWPYDMPGAAVEGILRAVVDALASHVYTSQLKGLPEAYAEAVAAAAGVSSWIPRVRQRPATPFDVLNQLDDLAKVINRRIVIWVDDIERFAFGDPGTGDKDPAELGRLSPIRALLYGLDRLDSITVVTATTNLFQRFDLEKVARYVERIPDILPRTARNIVGRARQEWMKRTPYLDPVKNRTKLGWDLEYCNGLEFLDYAVHDFATAVCALAATPRSLKQALRRVSETWDRQTGEIDIDDLLAMSMIREAVPDAFAIIEQHARKLRGLDLDYRRDEKQSAVALVVKQVRELNLDERTQKAVAQIVQTMFDANVAHPQGLRRSNHVDYWQRFMAGTEIRAAESDQVVLRTLVSGTDVDIVKMLSDPTRFLAVEDFAQLLSTERIQGLLLPLVGLHLEDDPMTWPEQKELPGMVPFWRMLLDRHDLDVGRLTEDTLKAIELAAPKNLALMEQVRQWIIAQSSQVRSLLPDAERTKVINRSLELLRDLYTGKPEALAASLRNAFPYTLYSLFWTKGQQSSGSKHEPFSGWPQFADTLRMALSSNAIDIARQISGLVVRQVGSPDQLVFDIQRCEALFGNPDALIAELKTALAGRDAGTLVTALLEKRESPHSDEEGEPMLDADDDIDNDREEDVDDGAGAT